MKNIRELCEGCKGKLICDCVYVIVGKLEGSSKGVAALGGNLVKMGALAERSIGEIRVAFRRRSRKVLGEFCGDFI